jgi:hypothetical protein
LKKNYFSSHKLPKQQSISFWSQGILGVNGEDVPTQREDGKSSTKEEEMFNKEDNKGDNKGSGGFGWRFKFERRRICSKVVVVVVVVVVALGVASCPPMGY